MHTHINAQSDHSVHNTHYLLHVRKGRHVTLIPTYSFHLRQQYTHYQGLEMWIALSAFVGVHADRSSADGLASILAG